MYVVKIIRKHFFIIALLVMPWLVIPPVSAADKGWFNTFTDNVAETWRQPEHYDLYVPAITWHARFAYDKEKTDRYNERPWGVGFGQSRWDDQGNWHGLYMMAFKDSFNKWEPIGGYGWEKTWRPLEDDNFRLGLGFTAGVTARDNWHYIPIPVLLPLASIGYGPATFQMTYIPGSYNNGNVYFAWMRFQF
ncbi:lipid IV(A) palmitoyltransferase PagP [Salmonella enterica]|uniref:Lipid A acyltransferase PagP n=1 Tax=Salmonella enterica subsp. VII serovar 40:z4,z24:[z39] TaxID=1967625 RepID=A0A731TDG5_SALEE|nr:lipid IV(A) palmitoyltransferase PagP [Salmonella enterica]EDO5296975.1 lipid IV(A) palmitoyltransferase PagP [Salmonella enterica subsp. houtenae serovar 40:z4,z24:-]EDS6440026.1 lipid IV(A) palmitoyltransferase PagP [Salmonella enterica subsp. VII str. CFSAN000550]EDT6884530.1 lipid IV(A) palmitoyltransferase PagP [Salmonella enterica subsp. enterica]EDU7901169.1 lipid IV(A) palmitoyltransferase PagP [Salmonella enterica subsp. houtenae]QJY68915.1 lipid IV(A) palmitoyltransferase PagP [Sa